MKFVDVEIPVYVKDGCARTPETLCVRMTVYDGATSREVVNRLAELIENKLNTVDIGDCE